MIKKTNRKYYEKPRINEVKLEIEEAVLTGCKVEVGAMGSKNKTCSHQQCQTTQGS